MSKFQITSKAGVDFGVYEGATAAEAFAAMVRDGGSSGGAEGTAHDWHIAEVVTKTISQIVAAALEGASEAHLEDIAAHGIHNITNDYSDDEDTYTAFEDEFEEQAKAGLERIEAARMAEFRAA